LKTRICVITSARSDYGPLRWTMRSLKEDSSFDFKLIVTGSHLSPEYGFTYRDIEKDGFEADSKVEMLLSSDSSTAIAKSMGLCTIGLVDALERINPDCVLVLGDRYELLSICSTALVMRIPIVHISGGDVTKGAVDNEIRNAVSQMADLHFPCTAASAKRLMQMGICEDRIEIVGEPGLDNFRKLMLLNREEIATDLDLDPQRKWVLLTYHPETKIETAENMRILQDLIDIIVTETDAQVIATYANADEGGHSINDYLEMATSMRPDRLKVFKSLGQVRYLSLMKESAMVAGNSSSGIVEAPFLGVPVLNIGSRQEGRYLCKNVRSVSSKKEEMRQAIADFRKSSFKRFEPDMYYGDGYTAERITTSLKHRYGRLSQLVC